MAWPQTVHVPPLLHAVASCALLTQLVLLYMKGAKKNLFQPPMRGSHPGTLLSSGRWEVLRYIGVVIEIVLLHTNTILGHTWEVSICVLLKARTATIL